MTILRLQILDTSTLVGQGGGAIFSLILMLKIVSKGRVINLLFERYAIAEERSEVVKVYERSIRVAREVFIEEGRKFLSDCDHSLMADLCKIVESVYERGAFSVYLYCEKDDMVGRVLSRARPAEDSIT